VDLKTIQKILFVGKCSLLLQSKGEELKVETLDHLSDLVADYSLIVTRKLWDKLLQEFQLIEKFKLFNQLFLLGNGRLFSQFAKTPLFAKSPTKNSERELKRNWKEIYSGKESILWDKNYANGFDGLEIVVAVDFPLSLVFSNDIVAIYQSTFQILFKLLRAETAIHSIWWKCKKNATHQMMGVLIRKLRSHIMMNVVDLNFRKLLALFSDEISKDFEFILKSHRQFLLRIQTGVFLVGNPTLRRTLDELLEIILVLCYEFEEQEAFEEENLQDFRKQYALFTDLLAASKLDILA
jgi:hypothetical protein